MSFIKKVEYYSEKLDRLGNIIDKLEATLNWNRIPVEKRFDYYLQLSGYQKSVFEFTSKLLETNMKNLSNEHLLLLDMFNQLSPENKKKLLQFIESKVLPKN